MLPDPTTEQDEHPTSVLIDLDAEPERRPSQAHPLDLFSLVAGLLAVIGGGLYLLGDLTDLHVEPALVVAAVVVVLGAAGIVLALRRAAPA